MRMLVLLLLPSLALAETPKEKDIRKLLALTNQAQLGTQVIHQVLDAFKGSMPNVPASFWPELAAELKPEELLEKVIPIYDKQLSAAEIKDIIKFYESPTGKKLIKVTPAITSESMQLGQAWGREIGEKVVKKLQQKGLGKK
jgi:hypothetical protein